MTTTHVENMMRLIVTLQQSCGQDGTLPSIMTTLDQYQCHTLHRSEYSRESVLLQKKMELQVDFFTLKGQGKREEHTSAHSSLQLKLPWDLHRLLPLERF